MPVYPDGTLLRAQGDPTVFLIQNATRHGIPSDDILHALGFSANDVQVVDPSVINAISQGAVQGFPDGALLRGENSPTVWVVQSGVLQGIPSEEVFDSLGFSRADIVVVGDATINAMPKGEVVTVTPRPAPDTALAKLIGWRGQYTRVGTGFQAEVANTLGDFGTGNDGFDAVLAVPAGAVDADHAAISELDTAIAAADFSDGELALQTITPLFAEVAAFTAEGDGIMSGLASLLGI